MSSTGKTLYVVCDGPPTPSGSRFLDVEDDEGRSHVGRWTQGDDGLWRMPIKVGSGAQRTLLMRTLGRLKAICPADSKATESLISDIIKELEE